MKTKKVLLQGSRIVLIVFIFSSTVFSQTVESIYDTASVKPLFPKKVLLVAKAGTVLIQPPGAAGINAGIAFNASMSFHLGKNFYLKPVITFWNSDYKTEYSNETKNISVTGFFFEGEYVLTFDKLAFPIGFGLGSCSDGEERMPAVLMEIGALYQLKDDLNLYLGASYQPGAIIDFGGGGYSYAPAMIYAGISYRLK